MVQVSNIFAWLFPILMIAIVAQVVLRSSGMNQAWLDDLQWWLYGAASLIAIGYAVTTDSHVRVDIFHAHYTSARKNRLEIFGLVWLFLPFIILSWDFTLSYAISSVADRRRVGQPERVAQPVDPEGVHECRLRVHRRGDLGGLCAVPVADDAPCPLEAAFVCLSVHRSLR